MTRLTRDFYTRTDVVQIAVDLIGKQLFTHIDGMTASGIICETEAYAGTTDKASHAYGGRRTARTETMYALGGVAYVYLCYGIHSLFNIVTNKKGVPHAVLIRGVVPVTGTEVMLLRAGKERITDLSGTGPGRVSKILGIHYTHTGLDLAGIPGKNAGPNIWIEEAGMNIGPEQVRSGPRVGVDYAGEDAELPYRFTLASNAFPLVR